MTATTKQRWNVTVFHSIGGEERFSLDGGMSKEDIKTLIRLIVAANFQPQQIVNSFMQGDYRESVQFSVLEENHGFALKSMGGSPSVYAELVSE